MFRAMGRRWNGMPPWVSTVVLAAIFVAVTIALVTAFWVGVAAQLTGMGVAPKSKAFAPPGYAYIAKIKVVGSIGAYASQYYSSDEAYHHAWTLDTIDTLIGDDNNKAIYLWLDTPGGTVYESDELYLKLMEYKEKTSRPIYTYMGSMAASGGYYIASASDEIYANRNTWTGSIGVTLGTLFDVSGFLDEHGIRTETITSGRNKSMGSYYEPLTDEQRKIYQSLVDEAYDQFVAIVAEGRGMADKDVRTLADGRLYTAAQALDAGLIDAIYGEKEAEAAIKAKFEDGANIVSCYYNPDKSFSLFSSGGSGFSLWDFLRGSAGNTSPPAYKGDVAAVLDLVRDQTEAGAPPLQYLYTG